ncbi:MAG: sigma-70 family RNA polymerase sigma factor [Planctomycetota bacterium]|nr:sigma-70 family RNA polymerase sigma factor [Planctomycetota bacterium]
MATLTPPGSPGPEPGADRALVAAVLGGDRDRFAELVERHGAPVWAAVSRFLGDQDDAREVFQETWCRALERLASLKEPDRLRSWLLSIALNQCRSRGRRRREVSLDPALESRGFEPEATGLDPHAALERADERAQLRAAVARLPTRQREVVELRLAEGLSHAEIAAALGIREDNARANLYQALRRLKAELDGSAPKAPDGDER